MDSNNQSQGTFSKITNFFRGNPKQMNWKQSDEKEDWANKAVDALVKKLKKQPNGINKLQKALQDRSAQSDCVTIPRSMDGRLQVSNCKALPHVIYGRVWRWPDLQNHNELRSVPNCQFPFSKNKTNRTEDVCINPYHYERVVDSGTLPPILVPRCSEFAPDFSKLPFLQVQQTSMMNRNATYNNSRFGASSNGYSTSSQCSSDQNSPITPMPNQFNELQSQNYQYPTLDATPSPPYQCENYGYDQNQGEMIQVPYQEPEFWGTVAYYELNSRVGEQFQCNRNSYKLIVDGFTHPSCTTSNRFCLGQISNIARNSTIEATRRHIGKGISIFYTLNSNQKRELWLECLSEAKVFVQGPMTNYLHNLNQNIALKVLPKSRLKIFDETEFYNLLQRTCHSGFEATYGLTKLCTIRISFVKGWGPEYHRQDVTSCPCWIELHLNGPLKWLDEVLIKMGSPLMGITSVS